MNKEQLSRFFNEYNNKLNRISNSEKISKFIEWCNRNNIEEIILRLSSENKGGISNNYLLTFTTKRIIITRKSFMRKFLDIGYVAGLAPLPRVILEKDAKDKVTSKIMDSSKLLTSEDKNYSIMYSDIENLIFKKGIGSTIVNMFGRMIVSNYIIINTKDNSFKFTLPVNKNGKYESIFPWLQVLPLKILVDVD